jgi:alanine-synthesizing transaminase
MINNISRTLEIIKTDPGFLDLINTNFTAVQPLFPGEILLAEFKKYLQHRSYQADPKGLLLARKAISKYYLERGITVDPEYIIITASTSESYSLIFKTMTGAGDSILLPRPGYPLFEFLAGYEHLQIKFYDLRQEHSWQPDPNDIKKSKAKGIVVISPNNPTGSICSQSILDQIYEQVALQKQFLIIDEVFSSYDLSGKSLPVISSKDTGTPIFLLNGISKMFGLPDLKLAWIAIPGKKSKSSSGIIDRLETANDTYLNANYFIQSALPALFENSKEYQKCILDLLLKNLQTLRQFTDANRQYFSCNLPQGGIHAVINLKMKQELEEKIVLELLNKQKLSVHPGYFYDHQGHYAALIISLLNDPEKFAAGLSRILQFVIEYHLS